MLKTGGYLVSTISVLLLGYVSWGSASKDPILLSCLILGVIASAVGMLLRWLSYREERKPVEGATGQLASAPSRIRRGTAEQDDPVPMFRHRT